MAQPLSQGGIDYVDGGFSASGVMYALLDDLGELAARLGAIHTYDRRGYIVYQDDFAHGAGRWTVATSGTGAEVIVSATYPLRLPYCLKLIGGSTSGFSAEVRNFLGDLDPGKIGFEASVAFITDFDEFRIGIETKEGGDVKRGYILLSDTDQKIYYYDDGADYQELGDLPDVTIAQGRYHSMKLVLDFATGYYVRFLLGDIPYDLSPYPFEVFADSTAKQTKVTLKFKSRSGENDYCLVDCVIVTQSET